MATEKYQKYEGLEEGLGRKVKKSKMKVSGRSVFKLQQIKGKRSRPSGK